MRPVIFCKRTEEYTPPPNKNPGATDATDYTYNILSLSLQPQKNTYEENLLHRTYHIR